MDLCDLFKTISVNKKTPTEIFINLFKNEILLRMYEITEMCPEKIKLLEAIYNQSTLNQHDIDTKYNSFIHLFQVYILEGESINTIYDKQVETVKRIFYQSQSLK